jgi:hypothetical protein
MTNTNDFLRHIENQDMQLLDRAIALLWWIGREDPTEGLSGQAICAELEAVGHPKQNVSRLSAKLREDKRTSKAGSNGWRLHPRSRLELDTVYGFALKPKSLSLTDSVLPFDLFRNTRNYVERVVEQINKSYDAELWDCSAVMCRRLLETLIIETYEKAGRASEIKNNDGHFLMLNGLVTFLEKDSLLHLGRNAIKGLKDFKQLGDLSAHNRRFNARRDDIDRIRDGLRVASEELLHLSGLSNNTANTP